MALQRESMHPNGLQPHRPRWPSGVLFWALNMDAADGLTMAQRSQSSGVCSLPFSPHPGAAYHFRSAPVIGAAQGAPFTVLGEMEREEGEEERVSGGLRMLETAAADKAKAQAQNLVTCTSVQTI